MAKQLHEAGMPVVGLPKTIDNDLPGCDQTIGFATCVDVVSEALLRLRSTAESHDRVMVLELMGRDSGYIALHGGLSGGANVILIPEIPFSYESIVKKIEFRKSLGRKFTLIVVSEGAYALGDKPQYQKEAGGQETLGGIGKVVAQNLHDQLDIDTRVTVLGHLQRGGAPNALDKILATRLAIHGVDLIHKKRFGRLVVSVGNQMDSLPYEQVQAYARKTVSLEDDILQAAESLGICLGRNP